MLIANSLELVTFLFIIIILILDATKKTKEPSKCPKYVQTGREIKLECHVEGNPPPNITWSVGGEPIDSDLSNNSYTPRTTGVVDCTCSACNGIGECVNLTFHHSADSKCATVTYMTSSILNYN